MPLVAPPPEPLLSKAWRFTLAGPPWQLVWPWGRQRRRHHVYNFGGCLTWLVLAVVLFYAVVLAIAWAALVLEVWCAAAIGYLLVGFVDHFANHRSQPLVPRPHRF